MVLPLLVDENVHYEVFVQYDRVLEPSRASC
jgi:hypothetical protein